MTIFSNSLRRRLCRKEIIYAMVLSFFVMVISYFVESSLELQTFMRELHKFDVNNPRIALYAPEAVERLKRFSLENAASQGFSFYIFMEDGYTIYNYIANFIITLPVIMFLEDRQNGTEQLIAIRHGKGSYLAAEAGAICVTVGILVLVPSVLFWGITYLIAPCDFPLSQSFAPDPEDFFQILGLEKNVAWKYLVLIFVNVLTFVSKAFLTFALSLRIRKKSVILFVPILFSYAFEILCILLKLYDYGRLTYFDNSLSSLAPMFLSTMVPILLAAVILAVTNGKERSLNE